MNNALVGFNNKGRQIPLRVIDFAISISGGVVTCVQYQTESGGLVTRVGDEQVRAFGIGQGREGW
jgi:hypothetical protein